MTEEVAMTYEETLRYSQNIRRRIVDEHTKEALPKDLDTMKVVLSALKDMDRTALDERKNVIDQGNADSSRQVAEAMNEFIKLQRNRNPFMRADDDSPSAVGQVPQVDPSELGNHEVVPGEDEIGIVTETADEFMARMKSAEPTDTDL